MHRINIVATGVNMEIAIRSIGNSKGVVIPKPLLAQAGLEDLANVHITVEKGCIVLSRPTHDVRSGWAQAAESVAAQGDDDLLLGEFGNADDASLTW
jgi:antitoxin MazE